MEVLAVFAVLIFAAFVAGSYYGVWTGILKPVRRIWKDASGPLRRRLLAGWIELGLFVSLFMAFLIVAPFGPQTLVTPSGASESPCLLRFTSWFCSRSDKAAGAGKNAPDESGDGRRVTSFWAVSAGGLDRCGAHVRLVLTIVVSPGGSDAAGAHRRR